MMTQFFDTVLMQFIQEANTESCDYVVREMKGFLKTDMSSAASGSSERCGACDDEEKEEQCRE